MEAGENSRPLIVSAGVVLRDSRVMICRRRPEVHNGLKWEFPGGKLEPGESPEAALRRELDEELDIRVRVGRICDAVLYHYPGKAVLVLFYLCVIEDGEPRPVDCNAIRWVDPDALATYDFSGADAEFVRRLPGSARTQLRLRIQDKSRGP